MTDAAKYTPEALERVGDRAIAIGWADGEKSILQAATLRAQCPCANCVDEWTGEIKVDPAAVTHVGIAAMNQVGNYAFAIHFDDGHQTGIFTYKRLRQMAEAE